jgi:hypothetical protein
MYRCVRDAGATAEFEPDPATVTIKKMYRAGEAFYVSEVRTTTAGTQRALTLDGTWVSLKSASGHQLLEPVDGDPFDLQPPASPGNSNPFAAALSGDQTDFNPFSVDPDPAPTLISAPEPASAAAATGPADAAPVEAEKQKGKQKRIAEVIHNFEAESDGDLALTVGDIIVVTKAKEGEAWWKGYIQGNKKVKGHFPASFVQLLEPEPEPDLPQSSEQHAWLCICRPSFLTLETCLQAAAFAAPTKTSLTAKLLWDRHGKSVWGDSPDIGPGSWSGR